MILTNLQKEIVRKIESGRITDVWNFLNEFSLINEKTSVGGDELSITKDYHIYVFNDIEQTYKYLLEFIRTKNILLSSNLVFTLHGGSKYFDHPIGTKLDKIIQLLTSLNQEIIIPHPELTLFIKRFKTKAEIERFYQFWTPIGIAILTVILGTLANFLIYSNERNVYITNKNAFSDSLNVQLSSDKQVEKNKHEGFKIFNKDSIKTQ